MKRRAWQPFTPPLFASSACQSAPIGDSSCQPERQPTRLRIMEEIYTCRAAAPHWVGERLEVPSASEDPRYGRCGRRWRPVRHAQQCEAEMRGFRARAVRGRAQILNKFARLPRSNSYGLASFSPRLLGIGPRWAVSGAWIAFSPRFEQNPGHR